jgi:hypothetical protein
VRSEGTCQQDKLACALSTIPPLTLSLPPPRRRVCLRQRHGRSFLRREASPHGRGRPTERRGPNVLPRKRITGTFRMGSDAVESERPVHDVILGEYYLLRTPVTQAQYQAVMGENPSYFKGGRIPPGHHRTPRRRRARNPLGKEGGLKAYLSRHSRRRASR